MGTSTSAGNPANAAYAASDADVLPVEAQATAGAETRRAWVTATVIPRSLKEPVGFAPSSFRLIESSPHHLATRSRRTSGVFPSGWVRISSSLTSGRTSSRKRHTPDDSGTFPRVVRRASKILLSSDPRSVGGSYSSESSPPHFWHCVLVSRAGSTVPHASQI